MVDRAVSLVGNGSENTTIHPFKMEPGVNITANGVNLSGFGFDGINRYQSAIKVISDHNLITNNTCMNHHGDGILLEDSSYCTIISNTMNGNGISLFGSSLENWNSHTMDTTNTVNGNPVYYYRNVTGINVPLGAGQVILANCSEIVVIYLQ